VRKRSKLESLKVRFPDRAPEFDERIAAIDHTLSVQSFCRRCGRPLVSDQAKERGYGPECMKRSLLESADTPDQGKTP
jgi:hypothetical protein